MRDALERSVPTQLEPDEWHLPLIRPEDREEASSTEELAKISIGRCARVSYLTHAGTRDLAADVAPPRPPARKRPHVADGARRPAADPGRARAERVERQLPGLDRPPQARFPASRTRWPGARSKKSRSAPTKPSPPSCRRQSVEHLHERFGLGTILGTAFFGCSAGLLSPCPSPFMSALAARMTFTYSSRHRGEQQLDVVHFELVLLLGGHQPPFQLLPIRACESPRILLAALEDPFEVLDRSRRRPLRAARSKSRSLRSSSMSRAFQATTHEINTSDKKLWNSFGEARGYPVGYSASCQGVRMRGPSASPRR